MNLFTPNHVKLLNSCYPPTSALLTVGPDYSPNSHELSRLTYYASNHPGKLAKIGGELEKRLKVECRKAKSGNIRSRASLLISLAIFRSLATECRRDIALLSPSLIGSVDCTLASTPSDLEVTARAASVFTAWTTYTNGHLIGADSSMTRDYLSILKQFSSLSCSSSPDQETQNRTRLIGLAALTAALNSEALYNDIGNFGTQVSIILRPVMAILFETPISILDDQSSVVKDTPSSPYLAEFRTRPALERRAASIHVHVDGDKGPATADVSDASLHALFSLLSHANGAQLGYIMQSSFDNLDLLQTWTLREHCCWFAQRTADWSQYQYRYVVPTWLVERLVSQPDVSEASSLPNTLIAMITSVFSSPTPLINLSSADIMSNLLTLLLRRVTNGPEDITLPALVDCISSLGCHVYYSDQIQDLAGELVSRLVAIEVQGVLGKDKPNFDQSRSSAIRCLLEGLVGLVLAANENDATMSSQQEENSTDQMKKLRASEERAARRTKVPPDIWQDTLSLLCDNDPRVRKSCSNALIYYITQEMPKHGENDFAGIKPMRRVADTFRHNLGAFPNIGDTGNKFLNSIHAYVYILATSPTLGVSSSTPQNLPHMDPSSSTPSQDGHDLADNLSVPPNNNRRSFTLQHGPKARKESLILHLLEKTPTRYTTLAKASEEDYAHILKILTTIQFQIPLHGLLTGIPMLLALNGALDTEEFNVGLLHRIVTIKTIIAHVFLKVGQVWKIQELVTMSEKAIKHLSSLPNNNSAQYSNSSFGLDVDDMLFLITSSRTVQEAFGTDQEGLTKRLATKWTPELALRDFENSSGYETSFRGDGVSPLLKISPALMHIENISLQSLTRSTRGLGVTDLREALEGRSSMSNPALARPPSVSTLDHASSLGGDTHLRLTQTRSRSRTKKRSPVGGNGEVRDVLNRLGIGKQNSNLLKATFPAFQKSS